jgi:hypothetical protein
MTNTLYDSTNPSLIPSGPYLAGYINGLYPSYYQIVINNPTSDVLSITVKAKNSDGSYVAADILDIENGDATPDEAPGWTQAMRALRRPIIWNYCSRLGTWPDTKAAYVSLGVPAPDYWIADYTGQPHLVPGSFSTQWTDHDNDYDISQTLLGITPTPIPPIPPTPLPPITSYPVGELTMKVVAIKADINGNGYLPTGIPWSTFQSATIQGSDPAPDGDNEYWPGYCQAQNRNGMVTLCIIGCLPSVVRNVFVLTS